MTIHEITRYQLPEVVGRIEKRGSLSVVQKVRTWFRQLFGYAMVIVPDMENNPARDLHVVAVPLPPVQHNPFLRIEEIPSFLRILRTYQGRQVASPPGCDGHAAESLRAIPWFSAQRVHPVIGIQNPQTLQQIVEPASIPIQLFAIEPARDLAPVSFRDGRGRAVAPEFGRAITQRMCVFDEAPHAGGAVSLEGVELLGDVPEAALAACMPQQ